MSDDIFDVVIVGSGVAGAVIAKQLGIAQKRVLILEAGAPIPPDINAYMERFFRATAKVPEIPYTPAVMGPTGLPDPARQNVGRQNSIMLAGPNWRNSKISYAVQTGPLPFGSTYERIAGGTSMHWLGTSLRLLPSDFEMFDRYGKSPTAGVDRPKWVNWPIKYTDLKDAYVRAEAELGVSADRGKQGYLEIDFDTETAPNYSYPMPAIPLSTMDQAVSASLGKLDATALAAIGVDKASLQVRATPAARNSQPYRGRRVCAGNTNCIPICPIQAKYDPTVTLNDAMDTGFVKIMYRTVASAVVVDGPDAAVSQIDYLQYEKDNGPATGKGSVKAKMFVIAANAIETPRLLKMSPSKNGRPVGDSSHLLGKNLMDHPYYVAWAKTPDTAPPVFPYRGPLSTAGIEDARDGKFRETRGAFRLEIGNEGWNFVVGGDPDRTTIDFVNGTNAVGMNAKGQALLGKDLTRELNKAVTRQIRLGFLVEQPPEEKNAVTLSGKFKDGLGLPRPEIAYDLSPYTKRGIAAAKQMADAIFKAMDATPSVKASIGIPFPFSPGGNAKPTQLTYLGAGHMMGTYRMGKTRDIGVVNASQQSHDHTNLYLVGSGTFPTAGTANPTLTIVALCMKTADEIVVRLNQTP
jgi:choline dehydrogenase-like flavoprotein